MCFDAVVKVVCKIKYWINTNESRLDKATVVNGTQAGIYTLCSHCKGSMTA